MAAQYGDEVYEQLSTAFEDPSATIVYPYVYRILNSSARPTSEIPARTRTLTNPSEMARHSVPVSNRPVSPDAMSAVSSSRFTAESEPPRTPPRASTYQANPFMNGRTSSFSSQTDDEDPDAQLIKIIGHISSETTGALHKEGITQLHKFLKSYPHKKPRVDKMLDSTGPAFRKYIARALASRAAEDDEREVAVADTLSRGLHCASHNSLADHSYETGLEAVRREAPVSPRSTGSSSPRRSSVASDGDNDPKLSRLHDLFGYQGRPVRSSSGSVSVMVTPSSSSATVTSTAIGSGGGPGIEQADAIMTQLAGLRAGNERR